MATENLLQTFVEGCRLLEYGPSGNSGHLRRLHLHRFDHPICARWRSSCCGMICHYPLVLLWLHKDAVRLSSGKASFHLFRLRRLLANLDLRMVVQQWRIDRDR